MTSLTPANRSASASGQISPSPSSNGDEKNRTTDLAIGVLSAQTQVYPLVFSDGILSL